MAWDQTQFSEVDHPRGPISNVRSETYSWLIAPDCCYSLAKLLYSLGLLFLPFLRHSCWSYSHGFSLRCNNYHDCLSLKMHLYLQCVLGKGCCVAVPWCFWWGLQCCPGHVRVVVWQVVLWGLWGPRFILELFDSLPEVLQPSDVSPSRSPWSWDLGRQGPC